MVEPEVEIRIGTRADFSRDVLTWLREPPKAAGPAKRVIYLTAKQFARIFSARRLELLHLLRHKPGVSVQGLARQTHRYQEAISRDLGVLRSFGLLPAGRGAKTAAPALLHVHA